MSRADVDFDNASMLVRRRKKGRGARPRRLPLLPQAVSAFRALDEGGAWGAFSGGSLRKTFLLATEKVRRQGIAIPPIRPYDLSAQLRDGGVPRDEVPPRGEGTALTREVGDN